MCLNKFHYMNSNYCDNWTGGLRGSRGIVYAELQQPRQQWILGQSWPNVGATAPTLGHVEPTYISVWDPTQIRTKAWLYLE